MAGAARSRAALGAAFAAALLAVAAAAAPARPIEAPRAAAYEVTLVTGDRVAVSPVEGGRHAVTVTPADGPRPQFWVHQRAGDVYVIPSDVADLIPRRLDLALFNVTRLAEDGYAGRPLPLIAAYDSGRPAPPPGTTLTRRLESIGAVAVEAPAARAERLGRALAGLAKGPLDKLWLDPRVEASLDRSVPRIGAPQMWQAGHDGSGATVAVLDTGVDADHPDLAGAVAEARNFTFEPDAVDRNGHGTHVASIVAGRHPVLRGVAPGARLVSGKVLDQDGFGYGSSVIDGMEWAAVEQDADVVNMSLGFAPDHFEAGPIAEALDRLSAESGALFVVAAGNTGCDGCVDSPGIAARALTVGAVDGDDALADFSDRGPVGEDFAVKPDLTAPGVGIVAARAQGTAAGDPVNESHTRISGTSMAAPHVAGSAALLLDARPGSTPDQLKGALMSTASSAAGSVFGHGAGRVDVARAFASPVVAETGSVSFGHFRWPHDEREPVARTLTYRNRGAAPVTLALEAAMPGVTVAPARLTVPAGGTAEARLVLDTRRPAPGLHGGLLVARLPGGEVLRTPVGFHLEPEMYDLRVRGIARDGRPAWGGFTVLDVDDGSVNALRFVHGAPGPCTSEPGDAAPCVRVPPGTYSVIGVLFTNPAHTASAEFQWTVRNTSLTGLPEVRVSRDTELVLDARDAEEVVVRTPDHDAKANLGGAMEVAFHRTPERGEGAGDSVLLGPGRQLEERLFLQPTRRVSRGRFAAYTRWQLEEPAIRLDVPGGPRLDPYYYDPVYHSDNSWQYPRLDGVRRLRVVDAGTATAGELAGRDLRGALALVRRSDAISVPDQGANAAAAGAAMVAVYNDRPGANSDPGEISVRLELPTVRLTGEEGAALLRRLARGRVTARAEGVPASPYRYDLVLVEEDRIPRAPHHVLRARDLARVEARYHAQPGAPMTFSEVASPFQPWQEFSQSLIHPLLEAPRARYEYLSAGPTRWGRAVSTPESPYNFIWPQPPSAQMWLNEPGLTAYRPGERARMSWLEQPIAPGLDPQRPLQRGGDVMRVAMAAFVDAAGNYAKEGSSFFPDGFATDFRMYENGALIAQTDLQPEGTLEVSGEPAEYRIEYDVDNRAPWARLSTDTQTVWTFSSRRSAGVATQPLLTVDWDAGVDLRNRLEKRRLDVRVGHQPGAPGIPVRSLALALSYDDGASWRSAPVRRIGRDRWRVRLDRRGGFVSLRLRAADTRGNTIEQRIVRAFAR